MAKSAFDVTGREDDRKKPYKAVVTKVHDTTGDGSVNMLDVANLFKSGENELSELKGSGEFLAGDFRSDECVALLKEADIVSTNPPFSLFREYVAQLMEHGKKFVIVGSFNAVTYKEIFSLVKENKLWLGYRNLNRDMYFNITKEYQEYVVEHKKEGSAYKKVNGVVMGRLASACWFTNFDIKKRHEKLILYRKYCGNEADYPKYDNYDDIEVSNVNRIPGDWDGVMGVPVTFLDKYNPDQFEILGITDRQNTSGLRTRKYTPEDTPKYNDLNARSVLIVNGIPKNTYPRILVRRRQTNGN